MRYRYHGAGAPAAYRRVWHFKVARGWLAVHVYAIRGCSVNESLAMQCLYSTVTEIMSNIKYRVAIIIDIHAELVLVVIKH